LNSLYNIANNTPDFEKTADIDFDYYLDLLENKQKLYSIRLILRKVSGQIKNSKECLSFPHYLLLE